VIDNFFRGDTLILLAFLIKVILISISGVVSPGPITATTIATGARNKHAGALIGIGHGLLEIPLMVLIVLGADKLLSACPFQVVVGLAGGVVLIWMAIQMFKDSRRPIRQATVASTGRGPVATGFMLSASSPFFLIWWGTIGLGLVIQAKTLGILAFVLFTITHILCDVVWLEMLSQTSFRGAKLLGEKSFAMVLRVCAAALLYFAATFIWTAAHNILTWQ
jgi:threonine/homoserine/homoserine lactone efflux protein